MPYLILLKFKINFIQLIGNPEQDVQIILTQNSVQFCVRVALFKRDFISDARMELILGLRSISYIIKASKQSFT